MKSRAALATSAGLAGAIAIALVLWPIWLRAPMPAEYLTPVVGWWTPVRVATGAALGAVVAVVFALLASDRLRAVGGVFGGVAGAALAGAGAATIGPWLDPSNAALAGAGVGIGMVSVVLVPWLRDRGLLSLTVVSLAVAGVVVLGRSGSLREYREAEAFDEARDSVLQAGVTRVVASVPESWSDDWRLALVLALRPPHVPEAVDVLGVRTESEGELWLREAGWSVVRLGGERAEVLPPLRNDGPMAPHEIAWRIDQSGPAAFPRPTEGRFVLRVATPLGLVSQAVAEPTHGVRLRGEALRRYRDWAARLPADCRVASSLVPDLFPRGSSWVETTLASATTSEEREPPR